MCVKAGTLSECDPPGRASRAHVLLHFLPAATDHYSTLGDSASLSQLQSLPDRARASIDAYAAWMPDGPGDQRVAVPGARAAAPRRSVRPDRDVVDDYLLSEDRREAVPSGDSNPMCRPREGTTMRTGLEGYSEPARQLHHRHQQCKTRSSRRRCPDAAVTVVMKPLGLEVINRICSVSAARLYCRMALRARCLARCTSNAVSCRHGRIPLTCRLDAGEAPAGGHHTETYRLAPS